MALSRAAQARQRSFACPDGSEFQRFWLKMEAKWLLLAESLAHAERTETFLRSVNGPAIDTLPTETDIKAPAQRVPDARLSAVGRETIEAHLRQAEEAARFGARLVERPKEIVAELERKRQDASAAKDLLRTFLALQNEHVSHRDRLRLELGLDP